MPGELDISVLIPTLDRLPVLRRTLAALGDQRLGDVRAEVVVVDNGSTDGTQEWLRALPADSALPVRSIFEPGGGAARARNAGIATAGGELILLLGDDVRPGDAGFIAGHVAAHQSAGKPNLGILGTIAWDPEREITPVMRWLDESGKQFDFAAPAAGATGPEHLYSSNVSLRRELLIEADGFDERFAKATWEDYELGLRLAQRGFELRYEPELIAYHDHHYTLRGSLARMTWVGTSARMLEALHPARDDLATPHPTGLKGVLGRALAPIATRLPLPDWLPGPLRSLHYRVAHFAALARGYAVRPSPADLEPRGGLRKQIEAGA